MLIYSAIKIQQFSISAAAHFSGFENIDDTPSRDLLGV
jgi:hypothetical protein